MDTAHCNKYKLKLTNTEKYNLKKTKWYMWKMQSADLPGIILNIAKCKRKDL